MEVGVADMVGAEVLELWGAAGGSLREMKNGVGGVDVVGRGLWRYHEAGRGLWGR